MNRPWGRREAVTAAILLLVAAAAISLKVSESRSALTDRLLSSDDERRAAAFKAASKLPPNKIEALSNDLIQKLKDPRPQTRRLAIYALRKFAKPSEKTIAAILPLVEDREESVRREAMIAMTESGPSAAPLLITWLSSPDRNRHDLAAAALNAMGAQALPVLRDALPKLAGPAQRDVVTLIGEIGSPAESLAGDLAAIANSSSVAAPSAAVALASVAPASTATVPALVRALASTKWGEGRESVVKALASLGTGAAAALPNLRPLFADARDGEREDEPRVLLARATIALLGAQPTLADLKKQRLSRDPIGRYLAYYQISETTPPPVSAVPDYIAGLADANPYVAARAAYGLLRLGPQNAGAFAADAIPRYIHVMVTTKPTVFSNAPSIFRTGLPRFGPPVVPYVMDAFKKSRIDFETADDTLNALGTAGDPMFQRFVVSVDRDTRLLAALQLGRHGDSSDDVQLSLRRAAEAGAGPRAERAKAVLASLDGAEVPAPSPAR